MSILAKINDNTTPTSFIINGHVEQQKEFMGTYQLIKEKFNDEYIYKKTDKDYYFYHSNNNTWLFCYSKNDINVGLGGIRVSLKKNLDVDRKDLNKEYILNFDCYTYNNEWILDNKINFQIVEDSPIIPE